MSDAPPLVIWGASGHARVVADMIRLAGRYNLVGFLDDVHPERQGEEFCGAPILGGREQLGPLRERGVRHVILGFGDCAARLRLAALVSAQGFDLGTAVHPAAVLAADVPVGAGTVIMAGAVVNPGARIGANAIVNTSASVDHDCVVEDGAHLSPGVHLGGQVRVGRGTWLGIGAVVRDHVSIGAGTIVGAGALVLRDVPDGVVAYGVPARIVRRVAADE